MTTLSSLPGDNSHVTVQERADMIEDYGGAVDVQIARKSIMRRFVNLHSIRGTDTKTVRRMGDSTLQSVRDADAGQEVAATKRNFDRAQVTVDTIIIARDVRALLNEFQSDVNARVEIGEDHGKTLGKFFDAALLSMGVKTAQLNVTGGVASGIKGIQGRDLGDAFKSGYNTDLVAAGDESDPDKLYTAFSKIITDMQENDVDTDECGLFLRPTAHEVLLNNNKLIDRDFSMDNGDFANGTIKTLRGVPLINTTRLADANIDLSLLSDGAEYVPDAKDLRCKGLIMHPKTLLGGETIPLTADVWYNKERLSWFIQAYMAFGAAPRRPDQTGAVFASA